MKFFAASLAIAAVLAVASPVLADDSAPSVVCHIPATGEHTTAVATLKDNSTVTLVCVPAQMMMEPGMRKIGRVAAKRRAYGPNIDGMSTAESVDAAWKNYVDHLFFM
jgi:hypothetical protein